MFKHVIWKVFGSVFLIPCPVLMSPYLSEEKCNVLVFSFFGLKQVFCFVFLLPMANTSVLFLFLRPWDPKSDMLFSSSFFGVRLKLCSVFVLPWAKKKCCVLNC